MNEGLDEYTKNLKIDRERFNEALDEYYDLHGWDRETGVPKEETLERLGLNFEAGVQK
jgi:aldehyde:ferredoxin oxidoreductase